MRWHLFFIIVTIIFRAIQGGREWVNNNSSPIETKKAKVVAKRTSVDRYRGAGNRRRGRNVTTYYITFELENGERMEFKVKDKEYGMLAERDEGELTFQGTRYKGFERT